MAQFARGTNLEFLKSNDVSVAARVVSHFSTSRLEFSRFIPIHVFKRDLRSFVCTTDVTNPQIPLIRWVYQSVASNSRQIEVAVPG